MEQSFFFQALVYLAAAVIFVPIAKKLGLGSVLGYLIAGIIIGPSILGFIGSEGQDLMHFAEFGVVMMLFLVGLELEPEILWKLRAPILGLGGLQVVVTSVVIGICAAAAGMAWNEAAALGMILSLSSTAIVLQTLNEKGLLKTNAGQSSFSVLLFQDIAVIPMLALMPLLASEAAAGGDALHGTGTWIDTIPGWMRTLVVLGSILGIIAAGIFLIRPLLRIIASTRLREIFTAFALLLVVGIAELMTLVGLSPALGTFLAGVVLANSEYRHELESDIEPFKGLLLGLFFIAVGASVDFPMIMQQPGTIALLVILLMAVKTVVLFLLGKVFGLSMDQNLLFAFGLSQVGEFAFVLFSFSVQQNIFDETVVGVMVAVVAISMAMTPLVMLLNETFIRPRFGTRETVETRASDHIEEKNPVIIAGFGKFGNIVGRFLKANGVGTTVLDNNSDRVETLRKFGYKVYYGDATRYDLLHSAGAADAKMIIITLGEIDRAVELVKTVKKHFPHLHIMVRSDDRPEAYDLFDAGVLHVYRETIDTSLRLGVDAMKLLGFRAHSAQRAAHMFLKHDEEALKKLASLRNDGKQYVRTAREFIAELETLIQSDINNKNIERDTGWDVESLRADVLKRTAAKQPSS